MEYRCKIFFILRRHLGSLIQNLIGKYSIEVWQHKLEVFLYNQYLRLDLYVNLLSSFFFFFNKLIIKIKKKKKKKKKKTLNIPFTFNKNLFYYKHLLTII